ncbi:hypothetical protein RS030_6892 [Cryptosporidium xiaoi]|uniref:Uncharacterized protein n=1 Tax=Cryptosporidium xiaoi TaxID=659607 RepID=A0AAV9XXU9_9CRYT
MILNEDITTWSNVDCLFSFYSLRFLLVKVVSYSKLNNLEKSKYVIISHVLKPFLENHNNWIHYSKNTGRGCKNLSRKLGNRSGEYDPNLSKVRREEAYMYDFAKGSGKYYNDCVCIIKTL